MRVFADRVEAGHALGEAVREHLAGETRPAVVLAIPRGGVPVGAEVARALGAPLDVVVVRKLRVPFQPELGFGAVSADGHAEIDRHLVDRIGLSQEEVAGEIADRRAAVAERVRQYRAILPEPDLRDAVAVVVDDGIATGGTARLACATARRLGAARVVLAVPVGPPDLAATLAGAADDLVVLEQPADFHAVGQAYADFRQLQDADVEATLRRTAAEAD